MALETILTAAGYETRLIVDAVRRTFDRPPDVTDNASNGYGATSIWQTGGRLWQPVAAPDANSAAWTELPVKGGGFCDIVGADTLAAYGFVREKTSYASSCADISVTIAGVPTAFTIGFLANGEYDGDAHRNAARQADANTYVTCTKWYDHNGMYDAAKNASYAAPIVDFNFITGRYFLTAEGQGGTPRMLQFPIGAIASGTGPVTSGFGVNGNNFLVYAVGTGNVAAGNGGGYVCTLGDLANVVVADRRRYAFLCGASGTLQAAGAVSVNPVPTVPLNSQLSVSILNVSGTAATISTDERVGTVTIANNTAGYTSGFLFQNNGASTTNYAALQLTSLGIANVAQSAAKMAALRHSAYARFDIRPQVTRQVFLVGDSRTASALPLTKQFDSVGLQLAARLGKEARVYSMGNGAYQPAALQTSVVPTIIAQYAAGIETDVFILGAAINCFLIGGKTAAVALVELKALIVSLQSSLVRIVLVNELATSSATGLASTKLPELRALIGVQGAVGMGVADIIDMNVYPQVADPTNALYYYDGIHLTAAADAVIASKLANYITEQ